MKPVLLKSLLACCAGTLLVTGCVGPDPKKVEENPEAYYESFLTAANYRTIRRYPHVTADRVSFVHQVAFAGQSSALSDSERADLAVFLAEADIPAGSNVRLIPSSEGEREVTTNRMQTLATTLSQLGLSVVKGQESPDIQPDRVGVQVASVTVLLPECGTQNHNLGERPDFVKGCSLERNLGLMVANPQDLVEGRALGPADGEYTAAGIKRYREGGLPVLRDVAEETTKE